MERPQNVGVGRLEDEEYPVLDPVVKSLVKTGVGYHLFIIKHGCVYIFLSDLFHQCLESMEMINITRDYTTR